MRTEWTINKYISETNISNIVRRIMRDADISQTDVAEVIDRKVTVLRNRLTHGNFTLDEFVAMADMAGYKLQIVNGDNTIEIKPEDVCKEEMLTRLKGYKNRANEEAAQKLYDLPPEKFMDYLSQRDPEEIKEAYARFQAYFDKLRSIAENKK